MNYNKNKNEFFLNEKNKLITQNYYQEYNKIKFKNKNVKYAVIIIVFFVLFFYRSKRFHSDLNKIHIAMSLNDNYTYPIMVSITSIILNSNKDTFIEFHILIGKDVKTKNQKKISSLKRLNHNIKFSFHHVGNNFNGWIHGKKKLTVASFYRSIAAELIKNVDKIIYLDGDTLAYGDLSEMYNLNMDNFYFRGVREILPRRVETKLNRSRFICAGVMVMNLKLIRKDHVFKTFKKYYLKYFKKKKYYGDQHIINTLFRDKINFLPPKFGTWFMNKKYIKKYKSLKPIIYTTKELLEANKNPIIRHLWGTTKEGLFLKNKPWLIKEHCEIKKEWQYYAKKTGYYSSICKIYKNACLIKKRINEK